MLKRLAVSVEIRFIHWRKLGFKGIIYLLQVFLGTDELFCGLFSNLIKK